MRKLSAHPAALKRARRNAISGTVTWAGKEMINTVSASSGLPKKVFRGQKGQWKRYFARRPRANDDSGSAWLGTRAIQPLRYGTATPSGDGVSVRLGGNSFNFPGGFVATMRSGHTGIFKRKANAKGQKPTADRSNKWQWTWLPIQEQFIQVKGVSEAAARIRKQMPDYMTEILRDKLRDQLRKVS